MTAQTSAKDSPATAADKRDKATYPTPGQPPEHGSGHKGVLVIYTGGTIGSKPGHEGDPDSPQVVVPWDELYQKTAELKQIEEQFPVVAFEGIEALDSCNVEPSHWRQMATAIADRYDDYNGFVVLHGTDTMVYTANALSFMLLDLGKPVILTGAQRSALVDYRNDATQNIITALMLANPQVSGVPLIPEVCVYFGGTLWRGSRTAKKSTTGFDAYECPNFSALAVAGNKIDVDVNLVRKPDPGAEFRVRTELEENVLPIFISPGIQNTKMVQQQLETPNLKAVVVQAFGSGDIPTKPAFIELFRAARAKGVLLAAVSQCREGPVELGIYETSAALLEAGFVSAWDITLEAAHVKLMTLLGDEDATIEDAERDFQKSLAGEQSRSILITQFEQTGSVIHDGEAVGTHRVPGTVLNVPAERGRISQALIRLRTAKLNAPVGADGSKQTTTAVTIRIFSGITGRELQENAQSLSASTPGYVGAFVRYPKGEAAKSVSGSTGVQMFDVTDFVKTRVSPGERVSFTIVVDTPGASMTWQLAELAVYVRD